MPTAIHTVILGAEDGETPLTVAAAVVSVERREEPDFVGGVRLGLSAQLDVTVPPDTHPRTYFLSRLVGESEWVVDALFGSNGYPDFSHGFGARYLRLRGIAPELEDLLDSDARPGIGPGHRPRDPTRPPRGQRRFRFRTQGPRIAAPIRCQSCEPATNHTHPPTHEAATTNLTENHDDQRKPFAQPGARWPAARCRRRYVNLRGRGHARV